MSILGKLFLSLEIFPFSLHFHVYYCEDVNNILYFFNISRFCIDIHILIFGTGYLCLLFYFIAIFVWIFINCMILFTETTCLLTLFYIFLLLPHILLVIMPFFLHLVDIICCSSLPCISLNFFLCNISSDNLSMCIQTEKLCFSGEWNHLLLWNIPLYSIFCCRFTVLNINIVTQTTFCLVIAMLVQRIPYGQVNKIMASSIIMIQLKLRI